RLRATLTLPLASPVISPYVLSRKSSNGKPPIAPTRRSGRTAARPADTSRTTSTRSATADPTLLRTSNGKRSAMQRSKIVGGGNSAASDRCHCLTSLPSSSPLAFLSFSGMFERTTKLLDRHALSVVGINEALADTPVRSDDERRGNWHDPGVVPLVLRQVPASGCEQALHFLPDPDREIEGERIAIVDVGQYRERRLRLGFELQREFLPVRHDGDDPAVAGIH